jgi:putative flippase GtrA
MATFLRYAGAGATGTLVQYATLLALAGQFPQATSPLWITAFSTLGAVIGAGTNYLLNWRWTFPVKHPHRRTAPRFAAVAGLGVSINAAIVAVLTAMHIPLAPAQLTATATVLGTGYLLNREWTFQ